MLHCGSASFKCSSPASVTWVRLRTRDSKWVSPSRSISPASVTSVRLSANTVVCFGVRDSTSFANRIGPNERSAAAGYRRHRQPSSVSSTTDSTAIRHFDFRDEFLAQPAMRKSVRDCRRTSCGVKGRFYGTPFLQRSVSPMRVGIRRNLPKSMQLQRV
mgnify:CR=1 FL=1